MKSQCKKRMKLKEQFNVRVEKGLKEAVFQVCGELDYTRDELAEVALASLFGSRDGVIRAKKKKIEDKAKELQLSFEGPELFQPAGFAE